ncbi:MAG: hypothetical protein ACLVJ8_11395 [Ruthenibacterium lactatiformans]
MCPHHLPGQRAGGVWRLKTASAAAAVDVVFPVLHGKNGEDGTIQGLLGWPACLCGLRRAGQRGVHG